MREGSKKQYDRVTQENKNTDTAWFEAELVQVLVPTSP